MKANKGPIPFSRAPAMEVIKENRCVIKTVNPENIFRFPEGIVGFETIREYCILLNEKLSPFMFLQALDGSDVCFVCIETFLICPHYNITLPENTVSLLQLHSPDEALILSLVTVRKKVEDISANLLSPIVINMNTSLAQQVIVDNSSFPVRYRIWENFGKNISSLHVG